MIPRRKRGKKNLCLIKSTFLLLKNFIIAKQVIAFDFSFLLYIVKVDFSNAYQLDFENDLKMKFKK
jgi:hypothetical protein